MLNNTTERVLEGVEHVRHRPAMYIGDTGRNGLHHLIVEIVDNSIDEALAGYARNIWVTLNGDKSITVRDDGRGIPLSPIPETGMSGLEAAMTTLNAGSVIGHDRGYKVSGGLHGVGLSCVNFLSEWCEAIVERDGRRVRFRCVRGIPTRAAEEVGASDGHGTTITWLADTSIFGDIAYQQDMIADRIRHTAYLTKEVAIHYHNLLTGSEPMTYHYERGIADLVEQMNADNESLIDVIYIAGKRDDIEVEIAMKYVRSSTETVLTFVNNVHMTFGGTHVTGFRTALTRTINSYAHQMGALKNEDDNLSGENIRKGLTAVVSLRIKAPRFEGPTKTMLGNPEAQGIVDRILSDGLRQILQTDPVAGRRIIDKVMPNSI